MINIESVEKRLSMNLGKAAVNHESEVRISIEDAIYIDFVLSKLRPLIEFIRHKEKEEI